MSTIVTRAGKGSPLTNDEVDANFNNLNNTKLEVGGAITVADNVFTLQDNLDSTKQAQFQLSGLTTGVTFSYVLPLGNGSASNLVDQQSTQTLTGIKTFSGTATFSSPTNNFGTSTVGGIINLASGATTTGNTKTVNIGTGGLSGSTTAITVGSANGSTTTMNGITNFLDTGFTLQDDADTTKQARFQLSGLLTAQTTVYTLPVGFSAASLLLDAPSTQTINGIKTFSSATQNVGSSTAASTQQFAYGATTTGNTKTVNIGTGGLSGSTTAITVGSANGSTTTMLGSTVIGGVAGSQSLQVNSVASAVNYIQIVGAVTGGVPLISAIGTDVNVPLVLQGQGTGVVALGGSTATNSSLRITPSVAGVNYMQVGGGATGFAPSFAAGGADTNTGINFTSKGASRISFQGFNFGQAIFDAQPVASAVNFMRMTAAVTTGAPELSAQGSDTNVDLKLTPKGTGSVTINATTAITVPAGTTAQRPTGVTGMFRYNSTTPGFEGYNGTVWGAIGGGATASAITINTTTVSANTTIAAGNNGFSVGPIVVNSGATVTVTAGQRWVVI